HLLQYYPRRATRRADIRARTDEPRPRCRRYHSPEGPGRLCAVAVPIRGRWRRVRLRQPAALPGSARKRRRLGSVAHTNPDRMGDIPVGGRLDVALSPCTSVLVDTPPFPLHHELTQFRRSTLGLTPAAT